MKHFQLQGVHSGAVVDAVEETHEQDLRVALSSVTWLRLVLFRLLAHLDNDKVWYHIAFELV